MGSCHYCFNCGRCRGETPPGVYVHRCPVCGHRNETGSSVCARCQTSLYLDPARVLRRDDNGGYRAVSEPDGARVPTNMQEKAGR